MILAEFELVFENGTYVFRCQSNVEALRLRTRITTAWRSIPAADLADLGNEIIYNFPRMTTAQLRNHRTNTIFRNNSGRTPGQRFSFAYANMFSSTDVPNAILITIHID